MKNQKSAGIVLCLVAVSVFLAVCNNETKTKQTDSIGIKPVPLPVIVPGFNFPEDSNTIYGWMNNPSFAYNYDSASVYKHAWGVWAGLTSQTSEVYAGDTLLAYETWLGISDIREQIIRGNKSCENVPRATRLLLAEPHQFGHHLPVMERRQALMMEEQNDPTNRLPKLWVTVSYDPNAACFAMKNQILKQSVLNTYAKAGGIGNIPGFPNSAITIKPTYLVGEEKDGKILIPVWTGQPQDTLQAYGFRKWPKCVYVDVNNQQPANKQAVPVDKISTSPEAIAAATVNLNDFIHFKVDSLMAWHMNRSDSTEGVSGSNKAKAGQLAILVCMHVGTKEISNWTWQTFFWAPNPAVPGLPSSNLAASLRPSQLQGAASHYALATAYAMVLPNQPITGGTNTGVMPMLAYNPYLEAGFHGTAPEKGADFQLPSVLMKNIPQFGMQTNCMSCHAMATQSNAPGYTTDQYISMDTSMYNNQVLLDFAWSIQGNMILDAAPAAKK